MYLTFIELIAYRFPKFSNNSSSWSLGKFKENIFIEPILRLKSDLDLFK